MYVLNKKQSLLVSGRGTQFSVSLSYHNQNNPNVFKIKFEDGLDITMGVYLTSSIKVSFSLHIDIT